MVVKTTTLGPAAYESLRKLKRTKESFSRVIMRLVAEEQHTASSLLKDLSEVALSDEALDHVEEIRRLHESDFEQDVELEG
jgi:predicted CopG family antitoxin